MSRVYSQDYSQFSSCNSGKSSGSNIAASSSNTRRHLLQVYMSGTAILIQLQLYEVDTIISSVLEIKNLWCRKITDSDQGHTARKC